MAIFERMRIRLHLLVLFFLLKGVLLVAQGTETVTISNKDSLPPLANWEVYFVEHYNQLPLNSKPQFILHSKVDVDSFDLKKCSGVCWFRKRVCFDIEGESAELAMNFRLLGAAEVFIDGKKVIDFGTISDSEELEERVNVNGKLVVFHAEKGKTYEILIRYSNHLIRASYDRNGHRVFGIDVTVHTADYYIDKQLSYLLLNHSAGIFLISFYFILFFLHITIYLFNKYELSNLYYSFICFFAGLFTVSMVLPSYIDDAFILSIYGLLSFIFITFIFFFLPHMFRSFFKMTSPKWYRYMGFISVFGVLIAFVNLQVSTIIFTCIILTGTIETVRIVYIALRDKKQGAKIIGSGIIFFTLMILAIIVVAIVGGQIVTSNEFIGIVLILFFFLSVTGIPISITVYLAYSISLTNRSLSNKLIEVEELSAKSLEQEKEKQHILANQNETLEIQVNERTLEIVEQKKVIEEKNKDIIDSINYAKRIQSAMLPEESVFKSIFSDSFILYQPRDIVSGDFYYATELNGDKLIIAADCTGHGVPGALMSMVGCNIIHKLSNENEISDPKILIETLHTELRSALKQNIQGSVNRDGMDLAAILIRKNDILFAGANRPVIWFDQKYELKELKPTKTPVGGSHIEKIDIQVITLDKKGVKQLFLFSDGFADQFGGPEGKKLMVSKFKLWLNQIISLTTTEQFAFLTENFAKWKDTNEQVDDVMVIGIKV